MRIQPLSIESVNSIRSLKFIFSGIVSILIILSFFTYYTFHKYEEEVQLRMHSTRMIRGLQELEVEVLNAETGHRGFQLTRNPEYLTPYLNSKKSIGEKLSYLDSLSIDASTQAHRIDSLSKLIVRQYAVIEEIVKEVDSEGIKTFSQYEINLLAFGKQNMDKIRLLVDEIEEAEVSTLNNRFSQQRTQGKLVPALLIISNIVALGIMIYVFFYIYKLLKQKTRTEDELRQRQVQLVEAERLAHIGNWIWDKNKNTVEWSDGLYQIYKKSPITYKPDNEQYKNLIHPEDKNKVIEDAEQAIDKMVPYDLNYRLQLEDGTIKFVHAIGNPTINQDGVLDGYFGVTQDITEQKHFESMILQQSQELKRSNQDLEQFAYVASHDLQEPLRKIRAFGDRLQSKFADKLEETGIDYINRMQNAAERMQGLIDDLLTFSRVTRSDKPFEKHELNKIIEVVIEDMETTITENDAKINFQNLPAITCNEQEIKRLFQNIIGNAIKFRKPDVSPVINIACEPVRASKIKEEFPLQGNKIYYRIVVSDNGIGFGEKYQERIFNIFQRLHGRSEYKGSGIGLAICRKIVTNHEGFITAYGEENKGAEFIILLPKNLNKESHERTE